MRLSQYNQLDAMDCGPTCLRMVAKFYGRSYSLQSLRERCHITREGVSLLGISDAAESIGFRTTGVKITWEQLRDEMPMPCIVHWNQRHFVVVYSVVKRRRGTFVKVADPASGLLEYRAEDFLKSWLQSEDKSEGIALILEPTPQFYQEEGEEKKKYGFGYVFQYLRPYRSYIIQILLAMLTASIISLILPFITQSIVDTGIGTGNISFVVMLLIAQLFLALGYMANNLIRRWLMLHTTSRVSISLISDFLCKLMKLPISFFDSKMVGDIMQRIGDYNRIQAFLTGSLLSMVIAAVSFLIYSAIMAAYNTVILLVFFIGSALYIAWVLLFMKRRKKLDYMRFQQASANQSTIVQLIGGMQDIKLNNCEKQKRWDWERIQAKLFKVSVKSLSLGQAQEVGSTFIDQTKNILISFIAAKSVIDGNMTLGMMMALQYIMGQINAPISQFISFVQAAQDASISLERLGEIHEMKDEEPEDEDRLKDIPQDADIQFEDVVFQYEGPHSAKVLDGITVKIPAGKVTAIVGASGSGKTTMLKMLLGFYQPVSGKLTLNGTPLSLYSQKTWRERCGSVMQEGYIFADTISSNIAISSDNPDLEWVRCSAQIANISEWIEALPLGYNTRIGADGHGLSTGQKQRILIARAVYKDADYLFLDEATNALDANNERAIMEGLERFFEDKTVVIVAHRLSTVKNADNIVVLDNGRVTEQGTHQELTALRGKYYELVKNQLELGN
jgi:ABC-type bacteriocin/lantibiotic exporters, contain an N-terminal double-glycine peptidase domain